MNKPYQISIGDHGGLFHERAFATFEELVAAVRASAEQYPDKAICFSNSECCDDEDDGLTEDETETLEVAVIEGHRAGRPAIDVIARDTTTGKHLRRATMDEVLVWRQENAFVRDVDCKPVLIGEVLIDTWFGKGINHPCLAAK